MEGMTTVAVLARFDFKPGKEDEAEQFFQTGSAIVDKQPETTRWYAFRLGPCAYGAFAVFGSEEDRDALLASGGPSEARANADFFSQAPTFEKVEVVAVRDVSAQRNAPPIY